MSSSSSSNGGRNGSRGGGRKGGKRRNTFGGNNKGPSKKRIKKPQPPQNPNEGEVNAKRFVYDADGRATQMPKCTKRKLTKCTNAQRHKLKTDQNVKIATSTTEKTRLVKMAKALHGKSHKCPNSQNAN